jgi:adenylylsulfate kinase
MNNIFFSEGGVNRNHRESLLKQKSLVIWFTGLSGSGKSTLSINLEQALHEMGIKTFLLDGDNVRMGLNNDLAFSVQDRKENIRRIAEVCKLFVNAGIVVLSAFISPFEIDRELVKEIVGSTDHVEVFVNCPLEICEERDVKGLYKKARTGLIKDFTGIDSPYEKPISPDITINTNELTIKEAVDIMLKRIVPIIMDV